MVYYNPEGSLKAKLMYPLYLHPLLRKMWDVNSFSFPAFAIQKSIPHWNCHCVSSTNFQMLFDFGPFAILIFASQFHDWISCRISSDNIKVPIIVNHWVSIGTMGHKWSWWWRNFELTCFWNLSTLSYTNQGYLW